MKMLLLEDLLSKAPLTIYSRRYPSEISFFTDQLVLPTPRRTQVCQAEGFRLLRQASGRSWL